MKLLEIFNFHGYQKALASMVYQFFDKKSGSGISVNEQLATQLSKEEKHMQDLKTIFGKQI